MCHVSMTLHLNRLHPRTVYLSFEDAMFPLMGVFHFMFMLNNPITPVRPFTVLPVKSIRTLRLYDECRLHSTDAIPFLRHPVMHE